MTTLEQKFRAWTSPPSDNEEEKCERAIRMIKEAIAASNALSARSITVFLQGSYHNNTNVRNDSDVDVGVLCRDTFFCDLAEGQTAAGQGIDPATYSFSTFKADLKRALNEKFGAENVTPGNKAFDIKANTVRVDADVAPFFEHRRYSANGHYSVGVELHPDNGSPSRVINWPEDHHRNGVSKNNQTGRRYKSVVRILKRLKNEMASKGIDPADHIPGFLIECLVWNVPNSVLSGDSYENMVKESLRFLYVNTEEYSSCSEWGEVSEFKYLFKGAQPWSYQDANKFALSAWRYLGW
ncbi:MAG: nucleotidyltransferase [Pseudomonadota bacterium]